MKEYILDKKDAIEQRASNGWLLKWNIDDTWLKSPGFFYNYAWDSYSEVIASNLAEDIGINRHIHYEPCILIIDGVRVLGCESKDYKNGMKELNFQKLTELNIISNVYHNSYEGYTTLIKEIKSKFGINIQSYLEDIILLDSIILNTDRNLWNMSILIDKNKKAHECKIYDSGCSLGLAGINTGEFYEEYMYSNGFKAEPFDIYFENQVKYIRNNRVYKESLNRTKQIIDFIEKHFCMNNTYNVVNTILPEQMYFTKDLIIKRHNTIIKNKLWIQ